MTLAIFQISKASYNVYIKGRPEILGMDYITKLQQTIYNFQLVYILALCYCEYVVIQLPLDYMIVSLYTNEFRQSST